MAHHISSPGQFAGSAVSPDGLLRIKPIDVLLRQAEDNERGLKRSMGTLSLTFFGVAAIVGAGIFVLTGQAAATKAGPAIILSYVAAGIASGLAALCYAELASTVPVAGSAYTYSYAVLGELIAWIIGWDLILEYGVGAATVAAGWSGYFTDFLKSTFGITLSSKWVNPPFGTAANPHLTGFVNLPALLILLLITVLLIIGTNESARINNVIVAVKLAIVVFFIVVGAMHVHTANWHNFAPFGWHGIFTGAALIFFAYIGFDQISTAAEEVRDPQRTMPRGIFFSLFICTVLYMLVAAVLTGMVPFSKLNNPSPVSHAMIQIGLNWAATIISIGAIAGLTTVLLVLLFGQSRIFFAMSRDGLLPGMFGKIHPRFRTPYLANIIVGVLVAIVAGVTPIDKLAEMVNIGTLAAFVLISLAVIQLRRTQPGLPRGFHVPFVPVVPILSVLASLYLIYNLAHATWIRFVVWLVVGLLLYFAYSRRHSVLERPKPSDPQTAAGPSGA